MKYEAARPLYREGRIFDVGDEVHVEDDHDRKALIERGTIVEVKPKPTGKPKP